MNPAFFQSARMILLECHKSPADLSHTTVPLLKTRLDIMLVGDYVHVSCQIYSTKGIQRRNICYANLINTS